MERNSVGSYGALFVVEKGLSSKIEGLRKKKRTAAAMKCFVEPTSPWSESILRVKSEPESCPSPSQSFF